MDDGGYIEPNGSQTQQRESTVQHMMAPNESILLLLYTAQSYWYTFYIYAQDRSAQKNVGTTIKAYRHIPTAAIYSQQMYGCILCLVTFRCTKNMKNLPYHEQEYFVKQKASSEQDERLCAELSCTACYCYFYWAPLLCSATLCRTHSLLHVFCGAPGKTLLYTAEGRGLLLLRSVTLSAACNVRSPWEHTPEHT